MGNKGAGSDRGSGGRRNSGRGSGPAVGRGGGGPNEAPKSSSQPPRPDLELHRRCLFLAFLCGTHDPGSAVRVLWGALSLTAIWKFLRPVRRPLLLLRCDWVVRMAGEMARRWSGAGDIASIRFTPTEMADPVVGWWTSDDGSFEGATWTEESHVHGPFKALGAPPELLVTFAQPVALRAITIQARNCPRRIELIPDTARGVVLAIQPHLDTLISVTDQRVFAPILAEALPFPAEPAEVAVVYERAHRIVLPTLVAGGAAMHCRELRIRLLESREARWVGINFLAFFE